MNRKGPSNPEADRAVVSALGPGRASTLKPFSRTCATSTEPGSLMSGVPASLTRATLLPASRCPMIPDAFFASLNFSYDTRGLLIP
jgi:hypothetical protein